MNEDKITKVMEILLSDADFKAEYDTLQNEDEKEAVYQILLQGYNKQLSQEAAFNILDPLGLEGAQRVTRISQIADAAISLISLTVGIQLSKLRQELEDAKIGKKPILN